MRKTTTSKKLSGRWNVSIIQFCRMQPFYNENNRNKKEGVGREHRQPQNRVFKYAERGDNLLNNPGWQFGMSEIVIKPSHTRRTACFFIISPGWPPFVYSTPNPNAEGWTTGCGELNSSARAAPTEPRFSWNQISHLLSCSFAHTEESETKEGKINRSESREKTWKRQGTKGSHRNGMRGFEFQRTSSTDITTLLLK